MRRIFVTGAECVLTSIPFAAGSCIIFFSKDPGQNESIRYDKIVAARARMSNGYYNSGHVVRTIASRLLNEGQSE
jgi:hypothetical protein